MTEDRLLTIEQVAARLGVSSVTVRRLIRTDKLKAVRVGFQVRIPERELEKYLDHMEEES